LGTSWHRTPSGARLDFGARRRPGRHVCSDQKICNEQKSFKRAAKNFSALTADSDGVLRLSIAAVIRGWGARATSSLIDWGYFGSQRFAALDDRLESIASICFCRDDFRSTSASGHLRCPS
jgi:hypothetical protein